MLYAGRPLEYVDVPEEKAREGMKKGGIPEPVADALVEVMKDRRSGACGLLTHAVEQITKRSAKTFKGVRKIWLTFVDRVSGVGISEIFRQSDIPEPDRLRRALSSAGFGDCRPFHNRIGSRGPKIDVASRLLAL